MTKHVEIINKEIKRFIGENLVEGDAMFFNISHKVKQDTLKKLLLERYAFCRNASDPDDQRKRVTQFFKEIDSYLPMSYVDATKTTSSSSSLSSDTEEEAMVLTCEFWSLMGLTIFDDLKQNPEIHLGGFLRGRSATHDNDCALLLAILHRQLFGADLASVGKAYPHHWPLWVDFMQGHIATLTERLRQQILPLQKQLWSDVFNTLLKTIGMKDTQQTEKFVYQVFFNIINPFKALISTEQGFKPFAIQPMIMKANPGAKKGVYDVTVFSTLYHLLEGLLAQVKLQQLLSPATAAVIAELKVKLGHDRPTFADDAAPGADAAHLNLKVSTYGAINSASEDGRLMVTRYHGTLYAKVPKALALDHKIAANDECCACLIL